MARKRPRPVPVSAPAAAPTAVTAAPPAPAASVPAAPPPAPKATVAAPERSIVEVVAIRASKMLGSLQLAVISLSLFASVVFLGTLMEHWYNTKIAQDLVYRSWWFIGLLFLLSVNIFFAAAKKWPWKKHQTGFVITHIGLLTMLAGGILNAWKGVDAQMALIDTEDPNIKRMAASRFGTGENADSSAIFSDTSSIFIREMADPHGGRGSNPAGDKAKVIQEDFEGGPLPWNPDEKTTSRTDFKLSLLSWLRSPLGRSWSRAIDNTTTLEVIDYLPFAKRVPYGPPERGRGFPALQIEFRSGRVPFAMDGWMVLDPRDPSLAEFQPDFEMPGRIELLGVCPPGLLDNFLNPPARKALGTKGVVTFLAGDKRLTLDVAEAIRKNNWNDLGGGTQVHVTNYLPSWINDKAESALDPAVEFEVKSDGKVIGTLRVFARKVGVFGVGDREVPMTDSPFVAWYDGPDFQFGNDKRKGVLQIVQGPDGKLHYRSFNERESGFGLESTGIVVPGADYTPFWDRMKGRFRVLEYLPTAQEQDKFVAANVTPGKESSEDKLMYSAAIQCRLTDGKNKKEFWVPQGRPRTVQIGSRAFEVALGVKRRDLGFTLKLERAEQTVDPGTRAPASYTSYVLVYDAEKGINGKREVITMNEPLQHRGYKFYQSNYTDLEISDANGKPVSLSGFTVGYDPGLELKYLGSICLAAGIFMMFYMRAYFFKPKKKPAAAAANAA